MTLLVVCLICLIGILAGFGIVSLAGDARNSALNGTPGVMYAQVRAPSGRVVQGVCSEYSYSASGGVVSLIVDDVLYYAHPSNVLLIER